jgi:hypothetical protein
VIADEAMIVPPQLRVKANTGKPAASSSLPQHPPRQDRPKTPTAGGEIRQGENVQLDSDRMRWPVAPAREPQLKVIVYVVDDAVARVRGHRARAVGPG